MAEETYVEGLARRDARQDHYALMPHTVAPRHGTTEALNEYLSQYSSVEYQTCYRDEIRRIWASGAIITPDSLCYSCLNNGAPGCSECPTTPVV